MFLNVIHCATAPASEEISLSWENDVVKNTFTWNLNILPKVNFHKISLYSAYYSASLSNGKWSLFHQAIASFFLDAAAAASSPRVLFQNYRILAIFFLLITAILKIIIQWETLCTCACVWERYSSQWHSFPRELVTSLHFLSLSLSLSLPLPLSVLIIDKTDRTRD